MRLNPDFYNRQTTRVARELLGKWLIRKEKGKVIAGMITETEAYHGSNDRASHARVGRTLRTQVMFGPPGYTYVYLIYGIHHCLNFSTMADGFPAAVLIRAVDVPRGKGPGNVCKIFHITRKQNALPPDNTEVWIEDRGTVIPRSAIKATPRIGVAYAGEWALKPWRFTLKR
jgi:DNA-3-methyladenine glycosylase